MLFSFDGEWGDEDYWAPYGYDYIYSDDRDRDSLTQEFRLLSSPQGRLFNDRTDWVLGVYAQRLQESDDILSAGLYDDSVDEPWSFCTPAWTTARCKAPMNRKTMPCSAGLTAT